MTSDKFFIFDSESLNFVFESLEAQYGVEFKKDGINTNLNYSGAVVRDDLDIALSVVLSPLGIDHQTSGREIVLSKRQ